MLRSNQSCFRKQTRERTRNIIRYITACTAAAADATMMMHGSLGANGVDGSRGLVAVASCHHHLLKLKDLLATAAAAAVAARH
jgi:hypothetical protein